MKEYITTSETLDHYEDSLSNYTKEELLLLPYRHKEEGNKLVKSQLYLKSIQSYVKALISFHYLIDHDILNVTEQIIEYINNVEVIFLSL